MCKTFVFQRHQECDIFGTPHPKSGVYATEDCETFKRVIGVRDPQYQRVLLVDRKMVWKDGMGD